ncbi:MAG: hypothetical protein NTV51_12455 [Verrucomicrobia bacterium]|nr:hypothetical protein [Verrucomicrobiota bacterium]
MKTDFLGAGFDRNCAIALRLHEAGFNFPYLLAGSPFPADRVVRDAATAQAGGLTLADEKAIAATGPALSEFLEIARHTPGLKELVVKISDLPPLTGWITGGTTGFLFDPPGMARLDGAPWALPGTTVYRAPFRYFLKGAPVMKGAFFFAAPRPPLLTCAGILALVIESPKHPEKALELRVLAARRQAN